MLSASARPATSPGWWMKTILGLKEQRSPQIAPYSPCSALLLTRSHRAPVISGALYRKYSRVLFGTQPKSHTWCGAVRVLHPSDLGALTCVLGVRVLYSGGWHFADIEMNCNDYPIIGLVVQWVEWFSTNVHSGILYHSDLIVPLTNLNEWNVSSSCFHVLLCRVCVCVCVTGALCRRSSLFPPLYGLAGSLPPGRKRETKKSVFLFLFSELDWTSGPC
jgi:hypothetical protein